MRFMSTDSLLCGGLKRRLLFIPIILGVEVLRSNYTAYFRRLAMLVLFVLRLEFLILEREKERSTEHLPDLIKKALMYLYLQTVIALHMLTRNKECGIRCFWSCFSILG